MLSLLFDSVSQRRLLRGRLGLADATLESAAVFPFFDDAGEVHSLMVAVEGSPTISILRFRPGLIATTRLGSKTLDLSSSGLVDAGSAELEAMEQLWHFDPAWVLDRADYAGHPAVPILKSTNIVPFPPTIRRIWFERDLSRVTWLALRSNEGPTLERFKPETLDAARAERPAVVAAPAPWRHSPGWRLNPFWPGRPASRPLEALDLDVRQSDGRHQR